MPSPEEINLRLSNIIDTVEALKGRASATQSFGSAEELEEIGLLTMRLGAIEESIALYCEILLLRPELGGFHPSTRSVLTRQLGEKLNTYRALIVASGMLYSIDTKSIEQNITTVKAIGEDRNTIIHGLLSANQNGEIAFRGRGEPIRATIGELRGLTKRCQEAAKEVTTMFSAFYTDLVNRKSTIPSVETCVQSMLASSLPFLDSSNKVRQSTLVSREAELELRKAREKAATSRKALRNARERLRRANNRAGT